VPCELGGITSDFAALKDNLPLSKHASVSLKVMSPLISFFLVWLDDDDIDDWDECGRLNTIIASNNMT
jgi:hypothetical protein